MVEGDFPKADGEVLYASEINTIFSIVPIGSVTAWLKSYTNTPTLPSNWVECNGQTLSDSDSVFDGQVIPDLNGTTDSDKLFLRGSATSGTTGGAATHTHTIPDMNKWGAAGGSSGYTTTDASANIPPYYEVVWIIRIK